LHFEDNRGEHMQLCIWSSLSFLRSAFLLKTCLYVLQHKNKKQIENVSQPAQSHGSHLSCLVSNVAYLLYLGCTYLFIYLLNQIRTQKNENLILSPSHGYIQTKTTFMERRKYKVRDKTQWLLHNYFCTFSF
jgi:hypothetical protein